MPTDEFKIEVISGSDLATIPLFSCRGGPAQPLRGRDATAGWGGVDWKDRMEGTIRNYRGFGGGTPRFFLVLSVFSVFF